MEEDAGDLTPTLDEDVPRQSSNGAASDRLDYEPSENGSSKVNVCSHSLLL